MIELSKSIEGNNQLTALTSSTEMTTLLSDVKFTPTLVNALSDVDFIEYLQNSTIGYDHLNKELVVTNSNKGYSYVYSVENKVWYTISRSFKLLINAYSKLLAVTDVNVVSLSDELTNEKVPVMIITSAQSLDNQERFKKIERAILRTSFTTEIGNQTGFYLFASNDLNTWQFITGKQKSGEILKDLEIQRSHGSAKYFVFVYCGNVSTDSEIKTISLSFNLRLSNKIR